MSALEGLSGRSWQRISRCQRLRNLLVASSIEVTILGLDDDQPPPEMAGGVTHNVRVAEEEAQKEGWATPGVARVEVAAKQRPQRHSGERDQRSE
jgi:hypothetical protein